MSDADFKDHFSSLAQVYSQYRPTYPPELFAGLAKLVPARDHAWDVGCGNGQASHGLVEYFDKVTASDASAEQIKAARLHPRIDFIQAPAESAPLDNQSIDLILIAQALHWFDFGRFYAEVRRVAKPNALIAALGYEMFSATPAIDEIVHHLYEGVVGPYWAPERDYIQQGYRNIPFPFEDVTVPQMRMTSHWSLDQMMGYFGSWSATKRYRETNNSDPLPEIRQMLQEAWPKDRPDLTLHWPLTLRAGRVQTCPLHTAIALIRSPQTQHTTAFCW